MLTPYNNVLPIYAAIAGDVIGSWLEDKKEKLLTYTDYPLFCDKCFPTDDSVFTVAIAECLLDGDVTANSVVSHLQKWGREYPDAGFGTTTRKWIFSDNPTPYKSNRNGGAMRVSPCGVVANTLSEALELAATTCNVSHDTPEGVAGAQAIAAVVYLARMHKEKEEIKAYIEKQFGYDLDTSIEYQKEHYAGFSCEAKVTVPQAIRCFLESHDVESAIRLAISLGSDADTLASMAAAIAAAYYEELPFLHKLLKYIPQDMKNVLNRLNDKLEQQEMDRAQRFSALLSTAIDVFASRYSGKEFIDGGATRKWIMASLPDHFYTRFERLMMDELLKDKLEIYHHFTPDCADLKAKYSDPRYIRRILPDADRKAKQRLSCLSETEQERLQKEDDKLKDKSPKKTILNIPHYRYEESHFCNGHCQDANYVLDYNEEIEVWE